jgi:aminomethyltransferase
VFAVKFVKPDFIGREALWRRSQADLPQHRVGLQLAGRRIAREGAEVFANDRSVGRVTSGTFSPTLERPIAMAYVAAGSSTVGTQLAVDIRGQREAAEVVPLPFYKRSRG